MDDAHEERNGTQLSTFGRAAGTRNGGHAEPGWFPDPAGIYSQRYWDGDRWTDRVVDRNGVSASHQLRAPEREREVGASSADIDLTVSTEEQPGDVDQSAAAFATRVLERACALAGVDCRSSAMTADDAIAALPDELAEATVRVMHRTYAAAGDMHNVRWAEAKLDEIRARPPVEDETAPAEPEREPEPAATAQPDEANEPAVPAAWYRDPSTRHQHRYWDGNAWTDRVADDGVQAMDPLRWDPPRETSAAPSAPAADTRPGSTRGILERIRARRTLWIISTVVFTLLTVGYLLLPVNESATSVDGTRTVSLHCGSVLSPEATATRGAEITNASSICSAARQSNTTRVYLFAALALVSVALAAFAKVTGPGEPDDAAGARGREPAPREPPPR